jgi:hypothetical protein
VTTLQKNCATQQLARRVLNPKHFVLRWKNSLPYYYYYYAAVL